MKTAQIIRCSKTCNVLRMTKKSHMTAISQLIEQKITEEFHQLSAVLKAIPTEFKSTKKQTVAQNSRAL